ncbi:hypothetical protein MLD38_022543 [Melastoma candidum]|uniref:Uncharacterized protein n=1 Tax=Melastoma candidum TaxID=119954 RepID=A0ACB9QMM1_9MYRT|nr:hypothetical protein MLD38_022543 [Melastoma candidum]
MGIRNQTFVQAEELDTKITKLMNDVSLEETARRVKEETAKGVVSEGFSDQMIHDLSKCLVHSQESRKANKRQLWDFLPFVRHQMSAIMTGICRKYGRWSQRLRHLPNFIAAFHGLVDESFVVSSCCGHVCARQGSSSGLLFCRKTAATN